MRFHFIRKITKVYTLCESYIFIDTTTFDDSAQRLNFINGSSETQCYNISVDFDMDDYCEQYSSCNNTLMSQLTKFNYDDHVILVNGMVEVYIKEQVGKCGKMLHHLVCTVDQYFVVIVPLFPLVYSRATRL